LVSCGQEGVEGGLKVAHREVGDVGQQMAAELAPAEFAEEFVDIAGQRRVLGRGKARGVPDLTRADLAAAQMRRQFRGAVAIGPVAIAAIAGHAGFEERFELGSRRCLARRPAVAQALGPIRLRGLEAPACQHVACGVWQAAQLDRVRAA
jgi:hypothetical protein